MNKFSFDKIQKKSGLKGAYFYRWLNFPFTKYQKSTFYLAKSSLENFIWLCIWNGSVFEKIIHGFDIFCGILSMSGFWVCRDFG
jgi:hypothetical protein